MHFKDIYVSPKHYFSIGIETCSGIYYLSIPVRNSKVEYSEYYKIAPDIFTKHQDNLEDLSYFAEECRNRLHDEDLFILPGKERGEPL